MIEHISMTMENNTLKKTMILVLTRKKLQLNDIFEVKKSLTENTRLKSVDLSHTCPQKFFLMDLGKKWETLLCVCFI